MPSSCLLRHAPSAQHRPWVPRLALHHFRDRLAGLLLVISVVTPAVFAWPLNLAALLVGLAIVISPSKVIADRRGSPRLTTWSAGNGDVGNLGPGREANSSKVTN